MKDNKYLAWAKRHKVWTGVIAFFLITFIISAANPPEKKKIEQKQSTPSPAQAVREEPKQQPAQPSVPKYEVVKEYGVGGKAILIDPTDATDEKLTLLGKELDKKYGKETLVRIGIFTDKKYALISADFDAIDKMSDSESKAYDQAYAAQFNINKNSGLKQYVLRPSLDAKRVEL